MLDTNFANVKKLEAAFQPRQHGRLFADEKDLIRKTLQMEEMDFLQLRNLYDFVKMYFSLKRSYALDMEQQLCLQNKEKLILVVVEFAMRRYRVAS